MHLNADISSALQLLENIKQIVDDSDDTKLQSSTTTDINTLISVLENPIFRSIVTVQDSLSELNQQLTQHPSILPSDFDINVTGELILNVPPVNEIYEQEFTSYDNNQEFDEQRVPSAQLSPGSPCNLTENSKDPLDTYAIDPNLLESNKILSANLLESNLSHEQAISILQKARGLVELVVSRNEDEEIVHRSPSAVSDNSKNSDINFEFVQIEAIDLVNDGTGLGFGIIGGRAMGVVVKTILPGGVADRDGRLQSGDHILQIGEVNLLEMGSEQVATVLRQSGTHVRLVVARPAEQTDYKSPQSAPIVPARLLSDPKELDGYLSTHGYQPIFKSQTNILDLMPELEKFTVELKKDVNGLGITIAGYVCEKEELSGIFVKSINKGSSADLNGRINVNDRIVEVNGKSLHGYTNHQAVEVLRNSGNTVVLCLERYLRGPKYEQLQQAIAQNENNTYNQNRYVLDKDSFDNDVIDNSLYNTMDKDTFDYVEAENRALFEKISDAELKFKWTQLLGDDVEIVVATLEKFGLSGGLGISLEGTVDVENGQEVRPHHYIRSILSDGPVGKNGVLKSGDELLEVNNHKLLGMNHLEVVSILKELPKYVRMVCGRSKLDVSKRDVYTQRNVLGGSLQNLIPTSDRLVKAKSDGSLATSTNETTNLSAQKVKSRSLEPLTGLAMWSSEPQIIELIKGERGLGFSILDYQDPIDPNDTVIVIRSLVPGGVAQLDGRLIPGDRLLFVNERNLESASLDQAVQALKGAAKGVVRIGVAKPLPVPDRPHVNTATVIE